MTSYLEFEKPLKDIDAKIAELRSDRKVDNSDKIARLEAKKKSEIKLLYSDLSDWDRVEIARHPERPHTVDYISSMVDCFVELCGDRMFADDQSIVGGLGYIGEEPVVVIGEEKGGDTDERIKHNFGSPKPEGYRKAVRLMDMADRFGLPVVMLVDTAGAFPGADSEARGISQAIAASIRRCLDLSVPTVSVVIGEGGSGGAIALAVANEVLMLENSIYSVISPEGCAAILWKDAKYKQDAAETLKLTAPALKKLGVIDAVIPEPVGGAHRHRDEAVAAVKAAVLKFLAKFKKKSPGEIRDHRIKKFEDMAK
ncbi:MAG: acetyl-CoA carboxylase carboxyltransferase subunit alpha [Rickettsiales bacterium]|jgi:acetyl-CoA carboxylase carboxyl transferase subunit alpha|nr:acetyl-CoA carboxylase carboxyltransferase subunit alpha [Rickettsiales bacterium]